MTLAATQTGGSDEMTRIIQFIKKWLPILLIASIATYVLTGRILSNDESIPALRAFIDSSDQIASEVGEIRNIKIVKRVAVSATANASAYRLYTIDVDGSGSARTVIVRVESSAGTEKIHLDSVFR